MAKSIKVEPGQLGEAVTQILTEYFDGIYDKADEAVAETAAETVLELQSNRPAGKYTTGKYDKSWKVRQNKKLKDNFEVEVHNTQYQLTHLLEHGHLKVVHGTVCGFTDAQPHIANAEKKAIKTLETRIKEAAKE